jgi:hypothetical protein
MLGSKRCSRNVIERRYDVIAGCQTNGSTDVAVLDLAGDPRGKVIGWSMTFEWL